MNELKPCPFCKTMPYTKVFPYAGKIEFIVACKKCGTRQLTRWKLPCSSMNFRDVQAMMDEAIEKWNIWRMGE